MKKLIVLIILLSNTSFASYYHKINLEQENSLHSFVANSNCNTKEMMSYRDQFSDKIFFEQLLSYNKRGLLPIHVAAMLGNIECLEYILLNAKYLGPPLLQGTPELINSRSSFLATPLHLAVYHKRLFSVDMLLNHGSDVSLKDSRGKIPLDYSRDTYITKKLLKAYEKQKDKSDFARYEKKKLDLIWGGKLVLSPDLRNWQPTVKDDL